MLQNCIIWLFQFLIFTVPLFFATNTDELFEFNKMILTYAITLCLIFVWLLRMILEKRVILKRSPFDIPLLLFLFTQIISTIWSMHPQTSFLGYYSRFHGGLLSTITYISLFYIFISNVQKKDLQKFFFSLFSSALLVSIYGVLEHFGHSPSCLLITGEFNVSCWIQDVQSRVFATFGQPNWLAAYAITIIPLAITLAATSKSKVLQIFYTMSSIALYAVLLFTKSRSGILGFVLSSFVLTGGYMYISQRKNLTHINTVSRNIVGGIVAILLILSLIFGTQYTPALSKIIRSDNQNNIAQKTTNSTVNRLDIGGTDSGEIRKIVWSGAIDVWKRYPVFGSGVETFAYSYYRDRPLTHNTVSEWDFLYNKAHNEYLNFLATTGILGLGAYIFLQFCFCYAAVKKMRTETSISSINLALALLAGYVALSVSNFFGFSTVMVGILFFLFPAILIVSTETTYTKSQINKAKRISESQPLNESITPYISITCVSVIFIICLASILRYWNGDVLFTQGKAYLGAGKYLEGFNLMSQAIKSNPDESLYYDNLADTYAQVASQLHLQGETTAAAEMATGAIDVSNTALQLNPVHINVYKTQIRVYLTLATIDPKYLSNAEAVSRQALEKAPTDAKLQFTLAQILNAERKKQEALVALEKTVSMKPNYEAAYQMLAEMYLAQNQLSKATENARVILETINPGNVRALEIATMSATEAK